ncbi:hypothetical protein ABEB36_012888 [Hypothenemus hampei]|uniref:Uncharacterized protein n=1 Tax=Hypothenemus hampei TaxID=57062 RepID=A0ABD1E636_HYPHA
MEEITRLTKTQEVLAKELQRIYTNMKKDSSSRKTQTYVQEKTAAVEKIWDEIKQNHDEMISLKDEKTEAAAYFKTQYFTQINEVYKDVIKYISYLDKAIGETPIKQESEQHKRMAKEIKIRINNLQELIMQTETEIQESKPTNRYTWLTKEIEKQWEIISQLNISIQINTTEGTESYFLSNEVQQMRHQYSEISEKLSAKIDSSTNNNQNPRQLTQSNVKLPEIKVPIFDGRYEDWPSFKTCSQRLFIKIDQSQEQKKCNTLKHTTRQGSKRKENMFQLPHARVHNKMPIKFFMSDLFQKASHAIAQRGTAKKYDK